MQFLGGNRRKLRLADDQRNACYPHSLQFYLQPPSGNISLIEFENLAIDRVKLLKAVENLGVSYVKGSEQYQSKLEAELRKLKFSYRENLGDEYEPRRRDHISHFILRLAYCQSEELRRWFIQQEMDLLRFRFSILPKDKIQSFLKDSHLQFEAISDEDKTLREQDIMASSHSLGGVQLELESVYKIPFADALDLFRGRKVYLENGFAYVPLKDIVAIILNEFRTKLSKALALTARSLPAVQSDERLQPLLNHLSHSYTGQDYSTQGNVGKVSLDQIDSLSTKSFPPCMRQLHKALRENHHLRHGGRMQYGLFLKGIGLTLEQALQFWKQEFIRGKMDPDKFDKGYSYNIRHSFGKEGKRTDYTPYSCLKIILTNPPSQGDYHGCPFRHSDPELLRQKLQAYKIPPSGISQILDLVKGTHYHLACQKFFEMTHNVDDCGFSLSHPNQFFFESQRILSGGKDFKKESVQPETPQSKLSVQRSKDASSALASLNSSLEMDLEGLEELLQ
ncbi:DNA primase large subunit isoform X2 [Globicephala melas]|nr:DNA primase large subunit isoform X1 [Tursiops truncatus]XP_019787021.1 DNA primase large subunit isoform X1 [Tursiops truncatus]XP_019787022.1 DNA primase large subunit isoform X1 [Tursiops truncatus]XP_030696825.1 DNA primase large subunit isoform X1 [Globicephala melas]XP_030696827.1 DNA primase large subunit isoform X2 [Globicephala melas]XP_030696828.1 DNA primase large subunit isoform X2 [Globicephala melas]XP_059877342.1 DNA primase large subunit isoform X1 [Delphinus delphis]XP_05